MTKLISGYSSLLATLGVGLALMSYSAHAQDEYSGSEEGADEVSDGDSGGLTSGGRRAYIAPMFSYTFADDNRNTDDGIGGVMSLGKRFTSGLNLELTATYNELDSKDADNQTLELSGVGAAAMVFPSQTFPTLYGILALHQGQATKHPTTPTSTGFDYRTTLFDTGIGYLLPVTQYLGGFEAYLRTEARYRMDAHNRRVAGIGAHKHFYEAVVNIGLLIPLGDLPVAPAEPVVEDAVAEEVEVVDTAPVDTDGDGVPDAQDQCPDTPAGAAVNEQGCEADTDGDGIVDRLDSCPDTPGGATVSEQGCTVSASGAEPAAAAGSGCRAPAPGEAISLEGCASGDAIVLRGVTFEFNSSRLAANAKVILNQVADALTARADLKLEIGGHTDSVGSDAYNLKLSERRARSVYDYLVARGITPSRMWARGYGETQPVDSNATNEGAELNRRVEMKIVDGNAN